MLYYCTEVKVKTYFRKLNKIKIRNLLTETILCCCWELIVLEGAKAGWLVIILTVCWLDALLKMFPITCAFYKKKVMLY